MAPPRRSDRSSTQTPHPSRASKAAAVRVLMPDPTRTASNVAMRQLYASALARAGLCRPAERSLTRCETPCHGAAREGMLERTLTARHPAKGAAMKKVTLGAIGVVYAVLAGALPATALGGSAGM